VTETADEISPGSWEYRLVAAVVRAVEHRVGSAGGPGSRWNGQLFEENDPGSLGGAHGDGSMSVSMEQVIEPLRRARDLDRPLTDAEAYAVRDAIATMTHEAAHLMARYGDMTAPDAYPYDDPATAFDEGRTEHWTHGNVDLVVADVFADAGLGHAVTAVQSQPNIDAYPAYTTAARNLDVALAERSGLTPDEVTRTLMCSDDSQRWNVAADLVIDQRLARPGLMPETDRAEVRRQLIVPLRQHLAGLRAVQDNFSLGPVQQTDASAEAAREAIAGLDAELGRIERRYRVANTGPQQNVRRPATGVEQDPPSAPHAPLPPDLKRLQTLTAAQAPAAGATRRPVRGDQAPERANDGSGGRQTPERPTGPQGPGLS
jgi:hypothetical protein